MTATIPPETPVETTQPFTEHDRALLAYLLAERHYEGAQRAGSSAELNRARSALGRAANVLATADGYEPVVKPPADPFFGIPGVGPLLGSSERVV